MFANNMHCNKLCSQSDDNRTETKLLKIQDSIKQFSIFSENELKFFEIHIDKIVEQGKNGILKQLTVNHTNLRQKYFFGERYTYGKQAKSMEKLYPKNSVDPIPTWIKIYIINPLTAAKILPENFVNSVVINDYQPGGCIVSHIDPPQIFDRPILSLSLFSNSTLCFGCNFKFKPVRCSKPLMELYMPRGVVTSLSGFAANEITHCVRPQDVTQRRAVIMLRRVLPSAPRLTQESKSAQLNLNNLKISSGHIPIKVPFDSFMKLCQNLKGNLASSNKFGIISKKCHRHKNQSHTLRSEQNYTFFLFT
ncbi:hypothetical protein JTB14_015069 [Gonioctena quinquepunctata]|nr:hypothetical protein JTB14_015069 [Gonioctena quinquepunctata]